MNVRTNLMLPDDLVAEVDRVAGPRNRSRFVELAIREAVERTAGSLTAEDYPQWTTTDDVVAWVRESRREVTDPGPEA